MKQPLIKSILTLVVLSVFSTVAIHAAVDDHEHEHKSHHKKDQKTQVKTSDKEENHHKHTDHHEHNNHESHGNEDEHKDGHDDHENHEEHDEEETQLNLDDKTRKEFGVQIDSAKSGQIKKTKLFPGEVSIHLDYLARVTPRFPGVVKKIYRHIGDEVKKGDLLAVIESNESLTPYKITAPITGTIIEKHLTIGESVEANSHAFEIANLNTVWITFSIFQDKFGDIIPGQKAIIKSSNGKHKVTGKISYISPTVDKHTRTQMGRIVLSNKNHYWRPGQFVDVNVVFSNVKGKVVVPNTAIQRIDNKPVIFIQEQDEFKPQPVKIGSSNETHSIILAGLKFGTSYVSSGGFILKSELEKGSMGHGHSH